MKTLALLVWALAIHVSMAWVVFTFFGLPMFVLYNGVVTGGLAFDGVRHRQEHR